LKALIKTASGEDDVGLKVLMAVEAANDAQKHVLGRKIKQRLGDDLTGRHFAVWGLAFKPNTDDMREAPSLELLADLLAAGATATAYDPAAMPEAQRVLGNEPRIRYAQTPNEALERADALVIVTEWKEFRSPDFDLIKAQLRQPLIVDGRNLYDPALMRGLGFDYLAIGR
jgi:UDPglucose 6-dehydrogenase